jgi:hypothetical protein
MILENAGTPPLHSPLIRHGASGGVFGPAFEASE